MQRRKRRQVDLNLETIATGIKDFYDRQVRQEGEKLGAVFERATQAVTGYEDLQDRAFALEAALGIHPSLTGDLRQLTALLEKDVRQLQQWRFGPAVKAVVSDK